MNEIKIFYSWQSDLPNNTNRKFIRESILLAISDIEYEDTIITLDEATRDVPGSPNIPTTIIEKIKRSDVFIGDLTITNSTCNCQKKSPNPNVVFELGYATAFLGWQRIIMLVNSDYSNNEKDPFAELPFDFDRNRGTKYNVDVLDKKTIKKSKEVLKKVLVDCISLILSKNPLKESDQRELTPEQIKRNRDLENIRWIMSTIHQPTLQDHVDSGPRYLQMRVLHFWESFNGIITNNLFYLYHGELYDEFLKLHKAWNKSLAFEDYYRHTNNPDLFVLANPGDAPLDEYQTRAWKQIENALRTINKTMNEINKIIRKDFIELNIEELNKIAWQEYISTVQRIEKKIKD